MSALDKVGTDRLLLWLDVAAADLSIAAETCWKGCEPEEDAERLLEKATTVGICLRLLDRKGVTVFDIQTAEKMMAAWEDEERKKNNA